MEFAAVIFMLVIGGAIALAIMTVQSVAARAGDAPSRAGLPDRDQLAASLLFQVLIAGSMCNDEAIRAIRRTGLDARITGGIDITSWGSRFAHATRPDDRWKLLETAVTLLATGAQPLPLHQYNALLDLSFALGFQTDALARLRELHPFEYVDHAKDGRPREADRSGGATTFFSRVPHGDEAGLLHMLELGEGPVTRQQIIAAYRRLAGACHPDRFHDEPEERRAEAAKRFIEITRAYETLLTLRRD